MPRKKKTVEVMTPKEQKFAEEIVTSGSRGKAMEAAGYKGNNAARIMKNPAVAEFLENFKRKVEKKVLCSYEWKIKKLIEIVEYEGDYDQHGNLRVDNRAKIAALAELNKMQGHYAPTSTVTIDVDNSEQLQKAARLYIDKLKEF
jgi:phage terminase small subunit